MNYIQLKDVSKYWGTTKALENLNIEIKKGEFVIFLGPSGCGKSTTLRLIAGLEEVSSGQIEIDGRNVNNTDPANRNVSMVFQSYALFPHLNVAENIIFGLKVRKVEKNEYWKWILGTIELETKPTYTPMKSQIHEYFLVLLNILQIQYHQFLILL